MNDPLRLLGVVLCGGRSSRMGKDKAMLSHRSGKSFLDHSVRRLAKLCDQVAVSGGSPTHEYRIIPDPIEHQGPAVGVAASLAAGMEDGFDACVFTPIDMPELKPSDIQALVETWRSAPKQIVCGISQPDGYLQPLVAIYPVDVRSSLDQLVTSEDRSLSRWLQHHDHLTVPMTSESCHNINTSADLQLKSHRNA